MTLQEALREAARQGLDRLDAQLLLGHVLERPREWLLAHDTDPLPEPALAQFTALVTRRQAGEPVAYLIGEKEFFGLRLAVTPDTLVPRPDTETLVEWALALPHSDSRWRVADLGTGSGCIALALKSARPQWQVLAVDRSPGALAVARHNGAQLGLAVDWREGSWVTPLTGERLHLIVSNPPYIEPGDPHLAALCHEPESALVASGRGLDDLRALATQTPGHLLPGGWLLLEHGHDQADAVAQLFTEAGFLSVDHRLDLGGHRRCTGGRWPGGR